MSDIVLVEISSIIEADEAGEEACEDMVFIYVSLCLRKNMYLTAVTGKADLWIKKYLVSTLREK